MNFLEIKSKNEWENFIKESGYDTSFFQSWAWGDFQKSLGHKVKRFGFFDNEKLSAIASLTEIEAKRGKYIYIRNGPVLDWKNRKLALFVINSIKYYAKQHGFWFVRVSPLITIDTSNADLLNDYPVSPMADVDALDTWILDITQSQEDIQRNMRKTTRYDIRKAEKMGVKVIKSQNAEDIDKFYPIYLDTIKRQQWTGYSKDYIKKEFQTYLQDGQANLFLAKFEDKFIAASIFIYHGNSSYYHYSGSLTEYRNIPAPALIQWENILEAKSRGLKHYNFWGIAPENKPNHPWQGLSFFKMGFGGQAYRWLPTRDIPVSIKYWLTYLYDRVEKWRKGY